MTDPEQPDSYPNLEPCIDCGAKVSRRARTCPHCGCPTDEFRDIPSRLLRDGVHLKSSDVGFLLMLIGGIGFGLSMLALFFFGTLSASQAEAMPGTVKFLLVVMAVSVGLLILGKIPSRVEFDQPPEESEDTEPRH